MDHDREANKRNAIEFYRMVYMGGPAEAVRRYVGAEYIHHNPGDGELVALHTHQVWLGGDEYVTMDHFRFDRESFSVMV